MDQQIRFQGHFTEPHFIRDFRAIRGKRIKKFTTDNTEIHGVMIRGSLDKFLKTPTMFCPEYYFILKILTQIVEIIAVAGNPDNKIPV